jgi:hypothetical protein
MQVCVCDVINLEESLKLWFMNNELVVKGFLNILSTPNSSLNHSNHIFIQKLYQVDSLYTAGSKLK